MAEFFSEVSKRQRNPIENFKTQSVGGGRSLYLEGPPTAGLHNAPAYIRALQRTNSHGHTIHQSFFI